MAAGAIVRYECRLRIGAGGPTSADTTPPWCAGKSLGASATSLTLTDEDVIAGTNTTIANGTTYTFQVRAVNAREDEVDDQGSNLSGDGDWSNEASARPTDGSERSYTISATIDGKSWAKAISDREVHPLHATVEVNPRFTAQSTKLWVDVVGAGVTANGVAEDGSPTTGGTTVEFGPADSRRDASFTVTPTFSTITPSENYITIAVLAEEDSLAATAMAVTRVEIRPSDTPDPPTGLRATRGDGEVTLSWATFTNEQGEIVEYDYEYRQRRATGFLWALDGLCGSRVPAGHDRDQQYGHGSHQRDVRLPGEGCARGRHHAVAGRPLRRGQRLAVGDDRWARRPGQLPPPPPAAAR